MKLFRDSAFAESLRIQKRVISALVLREIVTRYGRKNLGVLWLFVEPLLFTLMITLVWNAFRANTLSSLNIIAFMLTGYPMAMMWRNICSRSIGAISANTNLLYHRNVRPSDTIFARILLEAAGSTIAQILIIFGFIFIGWIDTPDDPLYMLLAWGIMALFGAGLGMVICFIAFHIDVFGKLWNVFSFFLLPLSGPFILTSAMPPQIQEWLLYVPMVHGTEMFRHGYFGNHITTMENPFYLLTWTFALLLIGLMMIRRFNKGISMQ